MQAVLAAAIAELTRVGFAALRVEDVAARAGVNKTTVYRRWPTKPELVRDAIASIPNRLPDPPDTGALRSDLLALVDHVVQTVRSFEGEGMMRMMLAERADPELTRIVADLRAQKERIPIAIVERAVLRGELPKHADPRMVIAVLIGAIHHRVFIQKTNPDAEFLSRLVDFVIAGAQHANV